MITDSYKSPSCCVFGSVTHLLSSSLRKNVLMYSPSFWLESGSAFPKLKQKSTCKFFSNWRTIEVRKYDFPDPGAPKIDMKRGSISSNERHIPKWHWGHARSLHSSPLSSIAWPLNENCVGWKRNWDSEPQIGSESKSGWLDTQQISSGGNLCQQWGQVTCCSRGDGTDKADLRSLSNSFFLWNEFNHNTSSVHMTYDFNYTRTVYTKQ